MGQVHRSIGGLAPASTDLRSEPWIVARMAEATLGQQPLPWNELVENYDEIRSLMERSLNGFEDYNVKVRDPHGFALPNPPRDSQSFETPSGKAQFTLHELPDVTLPPGQYVLMTMRSHDQYNTTIYGLHDRYRGVHGHRRVLFMNAEDMVERGWKTRQNVSITSHFDGEKRQADDWLVIPMKFQGETSVPISLKQTVWSPFIQPPMSQTRRPRNGLCAPFPPTAMLNWRRSNGIPYVPSIGLRTGNFTRIASVISMLGEWFNTIALFFLILEYTGSEFLLGLLFTV